MNEMVVGHEHRLADENAADINYCYRHFIQDCTPPPLPHTHIYILLLNVNENIEIEFVVKCSFWLILFAMHRILMGCVGL